MSNDSRIVLTFSPATSTTVGVIIEEVNFEEMKTPFDSSRFYVDPGVTTPPEFHDDHEIWYIAAGLGDVIAGGKVLPVKPGSVVRFNAGIEHSIRNTGNEPLLAFAAYWND